jgi:Protein of unknown function (DUF1688)
MSETVQRTDTLASVAHLRDPATVRERAHELLGRVRSGQSQHFRLDEHALKSCAQFVLKVTRDNYPNLDVPFHSRWRHFEAGGIDRAKPLIEHWRSIDASGKEVARAGIELAVVSVLLDAGAGPDWSYLESQQSFARSEGLAVASFHLFQSGAFANSKKLASFSANDLAAGFQVSETNPLIGLDSRAQLIQKLGSIYPERLGQLADDLIGQAINKKLPAKLILATVLEKFAPIWPVRLTLGAHSLGDCWRHSAIERNDASSGLVPFHKLSQWLSYSLMEPLQWAGIEVVELDAMTGLPEYRNGGLLLDQNVLLPIESNAVQQSWAVGDEFIVEWRALTVALLDEIAQSIRAELNLSAQQLPLVKILQGGSWLAGRIAAAQLRKGGGPPLTIVSDGTVF